jgi:aerobic-type carbon monoxide dehydrogenase small subunit (CoxS/CutS family)
MNGPVQLTVNGRRVEVAVDPLTALRTVLGEVLGLRSVRQPCSVGVCGGCTVLVDGHPVKSCLHPVGLVVDRPITTSEGLPPNDAVQAAFVAAGAVQCGYCTPGFVMTIHGLLAGDGPLDDEGIHAGLTGNLCRCGTYCRILEAVRSLRSIDPPGR